MSLGKSLHFQSYKFQKCAGRSYERCCVPNCSADRRYCSTLSFHRFPKNPCLRSAWLVKIRREDLFITKHTTFCSRLFNPEEKIITANGKRLLKSNAVPTLFDWNGYSCKSKVIERSRADTNEEEKALSEERPGPDTSPLSEEEEEEESDIPMPVDHVYRAGSTICVERDKYEGMVRELEELRRKVASSHGQSPFGLQRFSASPEDIYHYTRFASYEHLMAFWSLIENAATKMVRVAAQKESTSTETPTPVPTKLQPIDELFLFLSYLSTGCSHLELGHKFEIHRSIVSQIIVTWANALYCVLGSTLSRDFSCFYGDTQVVLDCTELKCQIESEPFSVHKSQCTFKAMVGVSPHGMVVFVSSLFEGSISDREVYQLSGVRSLLSPDMAIMVEKDFGEDLQPGSTSLSKKTQTPAEEVLKTKSISHLRGHVERVINRVKGNKLFDSVIPISISGSLNHIFTVACLLSNYQHGPLVKERHSKPD